MSTVTHSTVLSDCSDLRVGREEAVKQSTLVSVLALIFYFLIIWRSAIVQASVPRTSVLSCTTLQTVPAPMTAPQTQEDGVEIMPT